MLPPLTATVKGLLVLVRTVVPASPVAKAINWVEVIVMLFSSAVDMGSVLLTLYLVQRSLGEAADFLEKAGVNGFRVAVCNCVPHGQKAKQHVAIFRVNDAVSDRLRR